MKNESSWRPTKFVDVGGHLRANPDTAFVGIASRLNVNLLAASLQHALARFASGQLLDLGCGAVPLYIEYRKHVPEVTCVDWENSAHDISHLDVMADLNGPLPLESARFDTVILTDVLEHIAAPDGLLGEIRRVLRVGGVLIGSVPFLYRLHEEPHDHYRYTIHALRRMAARGGFAVEMIEPHGAGTDVLFDALGKILLTLHWRIGPVLAGWSQAFGGWFRETSFGRRLNSRHQSMPIGYVFVLRAVLDP